VTKGGGFGVGGVMKDGGFGVGGVMKDSGFGVGCVVKDGPVGRGRTPELCEPSALRVSRLVRRALRAGPCSAESREEPRGFSPGRNRVW
jgi:hypothetical protein